jgi:hypothetical protein
LYVESRNRSRSVSLLVPQMLAPHGSKKIEETKMVLDALLVAVSRVSRQLERTRVERRSREDTAYHGFYSRPLTDPPNDKQPESSDFLGDGAAHSSCSQ